MGDSMHGAYLQDMARRQYRTVMRWIVVFVVLGGVLVWLVWE